MDPIARSNHKSQANKVEVLTDHVSSLGKVARIQEFSHSPNTDRAWSNARHEKNQLALSVESFSTPNSTLSALSEDYHFLAKFTLSNQINSAITQSRAFLNLSGAFIAEFATSYQTHLKDMGASPETIDLRKSPFYCLIASHDAKNKASPFAVYLEIARRDLERGNLPRGETLHKLCSSLENMRGALSAMIHVLNFFATPENALSFFSIDWRSKANKMPHYTTYADAASEAHVATYLSPKLCATFAHYAAELREIELALSDCTFGSAHTESMP